MLRRPILTFQRSAFSFCSQPKVEAPVKKMARTQPRKDRKVAPLQDLFLASMKPHPQQGASKAAPSLVQSTSILDQKIKTLKAQEDSENKLVNLLEIYHLLENEKEIEGLYQQMQSLDFQKNQLIENIMFESYIRSDLKKAKAFVNYLDEFSLSQLIFQQNFQKYLHSLCHAQDNAGLSEFLTFLKKNELQLKDLDLSIFSALLKNFQVDMLSLDRLDIFCKFLKYINVKGHQFQHNTTIPNLKETIATLVDYEFPSHKLTQQGEDLQSILFLTLSQAKLLNTNNVDFALLGKFLAHTPNLDLLASLLTTIDQKHFFVKYIKPQMLKQISKSDLHSLYQKVEGKSSHESHLLAYILDQALLQNDTDLIADAYLNTKLQEKPVLKAIVDDYFLQSIPQLDLQNYHETFIQNKKRLNLQTSTALTECKCLLKDEKWQNALEVFYDKAIFSTCVAFQKEKVRGFLRALKDQYSQEQDLELIDAYIDAFVKEQNDGFYFQLFQSELSDNGFLTACLNYNIEEQQDKAFLEEMFQKVQKLNENDDEETKYYLKSLIEDGNQEPWLKELYESYDSLKEQQRDQQLLVDRKLSALSQITQGVCFFEDREQDINRPIKDPKDAMKKKKMINAGLSKAVEEFPIKINQELKIETKAQIQKAKKQKVSRLKKIVEQYDMISEAENQNYIFQKVNELAGVKEQKLQTKQMDKIKQITQEKPEIKTYMYKILDKQSLQQMFITYPKFYFEAGAQVKLVEDSNQVVISDLIAYSISQNQPQGLLMGLIYYSLTKKALPDNLRDSVKNYLLRDGVKAQIIESLSYTGPVAVKYKSVKCDIKIDLFILNAFLYSY